MLLGCFFPRIARIIGFVLTAHFHGFLVLKGEMLPASLLLEKKLNIKRNFLINKFFRLIGLCKLSSQHYF